MLRRSSFFLSNNKKKPTLISFITDIEGCYDDYWKNFLKRSKVLEEDSNTSSSSTITFKKEILDNFDCHFVFGGDAFDKGAGDIRLAKELMAFQDAFPNQVHFVLGNRDTNKLKLRTELLLENREKYTFPMPYYLNEKTFTPYSKFLLQEKEKSSFRFGGLDADSSVSAFPDDRERILLLKYLLKHRMGSAELFEFRRDELALLQNKSADQISVMDVFNSFVEMSSPNGLYHEFCKRGKLAVHIPNSGCVFVHGAINDDSFGLVPTFALQELPYCASSHVITRMSSDQEPLSLMTQIKPRESHNLGIVDIDEWFNALNKFKDDSLEEWERHPMYDPSKPNHRRGGASLFAYGHGRCVGAGTSVEVSTYVRKGQPQHIGFNTAAALTFNGITRIAVGHQPIGDTPFVISQPGGLTTIMGDLSYGDKKHSRAPNGRGDAVAEVLFLRNHETGEEETIIHGCTSDAQEYVFEKNEFSEGQSQETYCFAGKRSADGWWSIGLEKSQNKVLMRKTEDAYRTYQQEWVHYDDAFKKFFDNNKSDNNNNNNQQQRDGDATLEEAGVAKTVGFGDFFSSDYQSRPDLQPTAIPSKPPTEVVRDEATASFGKAKVKPKQ